MHPQAVDTPETDEERRHRVTSMFYAAAAAGPALVALCTGLEWVEDAAATGELRAALHLLRRTIGAYMIVLLASVIIQTHRREARVPDVFWSRGVAVAIAAFLGLEAGKWYIHLCAAGYKWIEASAMLGTPLIAGSLVFIFYRDRRTFGFLLAAIVIVTVRILSQPYLAWIHGEL